ncbi:hypothetical protein [Kitasatospora sp. NPDC094011]|uniref:hypothetical protein n=1 Tax=Kitasatospora sp. NPDC094011 TaxID=3364090 RepID=UPI0037F315FF
MTIRTATGDPFDGPRILFLGDSFVQGLGDPEFRGWVGRVLQAAAPDATAFNRGARGLTRGAGPPGRRLSAP